MIERLFLLPVRILLIIAFILFAAKGQGQIMADSLITQDSAIQKQDSISVFPNVKRDSLKISLQLPFTADSFLYRKRLFFSFTNPVRYTISEKKWEGKDIIFYSILALLLFFAVVKNSFTRYLSDLFSSYFRTTVRQRQIKEQLLQSPLPSLLFNVFFVLSTSLFIGLILRHYNLASQLPFWQLYIYSLAGLVLIYGGKFLLLKFFGWVFQQKAATDTYVFVVFSTNKILGILLLPLIVFIAFTYGYFHMVAITFSAILIGGMLAYRFFLSYISVNQSLKINFFHFLLYLAAFEILPLLLINKLLVAFLREIS